MTPTVEAAIEPVRWLLRGSGYALERQPGEQGAAWAAADGPASAIYTYARIRGAAYNHEVAEGIDR